VTPDKFRARKLLLELTWGLLEKENVKEGVVHVGGSSGRSKTLKVEEKSSRHHLDYKVLRRKAGWGGSISGDGGGNRFIPISPRKGDNPDSHLFTEKRGKKRGGAL